jgi:CheY-like chemotaxis protein
MTEKRRRLLCVEDDEETCTILKFLLGEFEVDAVPSGKEALEKLEGGGYSLIIMDHHLPDTTGVEVVRRIREFDTSTPVIFFTGSPDFTAQRARAFGAQDVVVKGRPDFAIQLQTKAGVLATD